MGSWISKVSTFLRETIWLERRGAQRAVGFGTRLLRVVILVGKGFYDNKCFLRASGLAFTTLLSLAPVLAFSFAILKSFDAETEVRQNIKEYIAAGRSDIAEQLMIYVDNVGNYIKQTRVTALGAVSLLFLLWTVVKLLDTVEGSFNDIWGINRSRPWLRKFSDYTSVVVITPLLLAGAITVSSYPFVSTGFLKGVMAWLGPVLLVWTAFAAFYAFMPNTRVKVSAALIGGIVSGTLWLALLWAYKTGQVKIGSYNVIYGSLAALPVFLMWLYFSWVITLFGAEVAFAYEHVETYRRKMENYRPSPAARERIALRVYFEIASAFHKGAAAPDGEALDRALRIPVRAVREVLEDLEGASLIARVETGSGGGFQPARDLAVVTPGGVVAAVRDAGDRVSAGDGPLWREALRLADGLESRLAEGDYARSISDIIAAGDAEAKS